MNDERGSLWRKWDLHVHTPESIVHNYSGSGDPWPRFLNELEALPPEFKVLGINDYIFLDGYRRILKEKASGRLQNIDLLLPVVELRIDKFGGSAGHLSRVNYHVIFSNELSPDTIQEQFLNGLTRSYQLAPQFATVGRGAWSGIITRQSLRDLGEKIIATVPPEKQREFGPPEIEGFNNLTISLDQVRELLGNEYLKSKFLTAIGKTEWASINWNDHSIADKKHIINAVDIVFISSETVDQWRKAKASLSSGRHPQRRQI